VGAAALQLHAMPGQFVKLRPVENVKVIMHEYHTEVFMHGLGITNEVMLCVACVFFFEFMPKPIYHTGIFLWIAGCLFGVTVSAYHMWEYNTAKSRYKGEVRHEMLELAMYMFSHITFVVGSILFFPWLYTTQTALTIGHACATWLWIWGSVALVVAGHWNAIGFIETATKLPVGRRTVLLRRCASVALTCTAIGAALFFAGSFLFRPGFKNQCESPQAFHPSSATDDTKDFGHMIEPDMMGKARMKLRGARDYSLTVEAVSAGQDPEPKGYELDGFCVSIIEQGTLLYLLGCLCFLVHSILNTCCSVLIHRIRLQEAKLEVTVACKRKGAVPRWASEEATAEAKAGSEVPPASSDCAPEKIGGEPA